MTLPVGMDYHLAEVTGSYGREAALAAIYAPFRAKCACGWVGPNRDDRHAAEEDAGEHDKAANDEDGVWER